MRKPIVIYESKYGHTASYAQWIAEALHCRLSPSGAITPEELEEYDLLIFGGGLYMGALNGVSILTQNAALLREKTVIVFTVSLSGVDDPDAFQPVIRKNFTPEMIEQLDFFHFRGGIDYSALTFSHKMLMAAKKLAVSLKSNKTEDDACMLRTYGERVDFRDESAIQPLVDYVRSCCLYVQDEPIV